MIGNPVQSKTRVALLTPCLGVGGADALILGLSKYAHNLCFTGVAVQQSMNTQQLEWSNCVNSGIPIHITVDPNHNTKEHKKLHYHKTFIDAIWKICRDADIVLSWGISDLKSILYNIDLPVIDYIQNASEHYRRIHASNKDVYYPVACSRAAMIGNCQIIYNGIDPGRVTPRLGRDLQRKVWGISNKDKLLLYMGRFVEEKQPASVIKALTNLPDWKAVFCGSGPLEKELYTQAQNYVPGRVFFIKPQYHVGDLFTSSDVFMLHSQYEGHPLALMEAMLAGIPTVYSDINCMKELESSFGPLGVMIPKLATNEQLSEAVIEASSHTDLAFTRINNARSVVWNNFTLSTIAWQWEEFIDYCVWDWRKRKRRTEIHPVKPLELLKEGELDGS